MYLAQYKGIVIKEFKEIIRDRFALFMTVLMPVLQVYLFTYSIETTVTDIRTIVVDYDDTQSSREFIRVLENTGSFEVIEYAYSNSRLEEALIEGSARVGIIIPASYQRLHLFGDPTVISAIIDGSDATIAAQAKLALMSVERYIDDKTAVDNYASRATEIRSSIRYNPAMDSDTFIVPGLIVILLQKIAIMMMAFAIVREKTTGTLEQVKLAVSSASVYVIGKVTPYVMILTAIFIVLLSIMTFQFAIHIDGSMLFLLGSSALFISLCLALGVLISFEAETHNQAMQLSYLILMPSILLSGFVFPRDLMPGPMMYLSLLLPATHYMEIVRGTVLRGGAWDTLWIYDLWLVAMLVGVVGLIWRAYRKM